MRTLFDNDMRTLNESELIYKITNRKKVELMEDFTFDDVMNQLTPGRKEVATAAVELYIRLKAKKKKSPIITHAKNVYNQMVALMANLSVEESWCVFLNQASRTIKKQRISRGGLTCTAVDVRVVIKEALLCGATALVLVHNHPSGSIRPSREDDKLTKELNTACELMNIRMVDHVIVTDGSFYSYADEGRI